MLSALVGVGCRGPPRLCATGATEAGVQVSRVATCTTKLSQACLPGGICTVTNGAGSAPPPPPPPPPLPLLLLSAGSAAAADAAVSGRPCASSASHCPAAAPSGTRTLSRPPAQLRRDVTVVAAEFVCGTSKAMRGEARHPRHVARGHVGLALALGSSKVSRGRRLAPPPLLPGPGAVAGLALAPADRERALVRAVWTRETSLSARMRVPVQNG
jgi:hypothetical protein